MSTNRNKDGTYQRKNNGTFRSVNGTTHDQKPLTTKLPLEADKLLRQKMQEQRETDKSASVSGYARNAILKQMREDGYLD